MANYLRYADDILRGGRRAVGDFVGTIAGKGVKNAQGSLNNARRTQDALGQLSPEDLYKQRMGVAPVNDNELGAAKRFYDNAVLSAVDNVEDAASDLSIAEANRGITRGMVGLGALGTGTFGIGYAGSQGAFDGVDFGSGSPTPTPTATPQITDRDFDYVAPTSKAPAYVPDTSKFDLKPTYIPSETLPPVPEAPVGEAFYRINKGDNLWNLTGGDTELINKIAAYNNLDPNKIYADADLRLKNEWLTPSSRLLNNTLAGIRYPG